MHSDGFVTKVFQTLLKGTFTSTCFTCSDRLKCVESVSASAQLPDPPAFYLTSYETKTYIPVLQGFCFCLLRFSSGSATTTTCTTRSIRVQWDLRIFTFKLFWFDCVASFQRHRLFCSFIRPQVCEFDQSATVTSLN